MSGISEYPFTGHFKPVYGLRHKGIKDIGVLHCLECGATLSHDAVNCPSCGNERNLLPERWDPDHGPEKVAVERVSFLEKDTQVLLGLSFALLFALIFLGYAKDRNNSTLSGRPLDGSPILVSEIPSGNVFDKPETTPSLIPQPTDLTGLRKRAVDAESSGAWSEAVRVWAEVSENPDALLSDYIALGNVRLKTGDISGANSAFSHAVVRFPGSPEGYIALGSLLENQGNYNSARFQYQVGLSYVPNNPDLTAGLERCLKALGEEGEVGVLPEAIPTGEIPPGDKILIADIPVIIPEPVERASEPNDLVSRDVRSQPANLLERKTGEEETNPVSESPVTLIGSNDGTQPVDEAPSESNPVEVTDLLVSATSEQVNIELMTDGKPEFSTRNAEGPSRLIVRLSNAVISPSATVPRSFSLNVPYAERVNLLEVNDDNKYVLMVIYLGGNVQTRIASGPNSIRVIIEGSGGEEDR